MILFPPHVFKFVYGRLLCPKFAKAIGLAVVMCVFVLLFPVSHPQFRGLDARDCNSEYTYECQAYRRVCLDFLFRPWVWFAKFSSA